MSSTEVSPKSVPSGGFFRTTGVLGLAVLVTRLCNLGVVSTLSHGVGNYAVGIYGLATLTAAFVALAGSLGFSTYLTRQRAIGAADLRLISQIHTARLAMVVLGAIATFVITSKFVTIETAIAFTSFAGAALLDQLNETAWSLIRGTRSAPREAMCNGGTYAALLITNLVLLSFGALHLVLAGATCLGWAVIRSCVASIVTGIQWRNSPVAIWQAVRSNVRAATPFMASDILGLAYLRGDTIVLSLFVTTQQVGLYVAAATIVAPLVQVASAMSMGALATASMARRSLHAPDSDRRLYGYFSSSGILIGCALSAGLYPVVKVLYSDGQSRITFLALILAIFIPLRFLNFSLSSVTLANGQAGRRLLIVSLSVVVNVCLNLVLDPHFHEAGAAWATVITEVAVTVSFVTGRGAVRINRWVWIVMGIAAAASLAQFAHKIGFAERFTGVIVAGVMAILLILAISLLGGSRDLRRRTIT